MTTTYQGRPSFIKKEQFRLWLNPHHLNKIASIDGIQAGSYIQRCERSGKPITSKNIHGVKRWRMLEIVARARANNHLVAPPCEAAEIHDINVLKQEKARLVAEIANAKHLLAMQQASTRLTRATLLNQQEIADARLELPNISGVYFLLQGEEVVYVGQSVAVFSRVIDHVKTKEFDGFSYIASEPKELDVLESLYIHTLRPKLNGRCGAGMAAPIRLDKLLGITK